MFLSLSSRKVIWISEVYILVHPRGLEPRLTALKGRGFSRLIYGCITNNAPSRDRTYDLSVKSRMLYHLSYRGVFTCMVLIITLKYFMSIYFLRLLDAHSIIDLNVEIKKNPAIWLGRSFSMIFWGGVDSPYDESFISLN